MLDSPTPREEKFYPYYADDVTESDWHRIAIRYLDESLARHFADRPDVYVSSNMFVYYEVDNTEKNVSPDVFVCFGSDKEQHRVHKIWEGGVPYAVFEITSASSRESDQGSKRVKYAVMGIQEYYLFDPLGEYLPGKLRVYRREGDELIPVLAPGRFSSEALGVEMVVEDALLRLYDLKTGLRYPTAQESAVMAAENEARAEENAARAEENAARAEENAARAEQERAAREAAEERVRHLEEELRRLKGE